MTLYKISWTDASGRARLDFMVSPRATLRAVRAMKLDGLRPTVRGYDPDHPKQRERDVGEGELDRLAGEVQHAAA